MAESNKHAWNLCWQTHLRRSGFNSQPQGTNRQGQRPACFPRKGCNKKHL